MNPAASRAVRIVFSSTTPPRVGITTTTQLTVTHAKDTNTDRGISFNYNTGTGVANNKLGFFGMDVDQTGSNADGFNFTLQLRWHFIDANSWSMFVEGGVGLLRTGANVPTGGSEFNFTIQLGSGFSFDAGNNNRWLVGARWFHISNANTYNNNPGRDSAMLWTGISFPY